MYHYCYTNSRTHVLYKQYSVNQFPVTAHRTLGLQQSSANAPSCELCTNFLPCFACFSGLLCHCFFQVILGLPFLLCPWGFQFRARFSMTVRPFLRVGLCPINFHFLRLICINPITSEQYVGDIIRTILRARKSFSNLSYIYKSECVCVCVCVCLYVQD
jgi:hypothetical protein